MRNDNALFIIAEKERCETSFVVKRRSSRENEKLERRGLIHTKKMYLNNDILKLNKFKLYHFRKGGISFLFLL